MVKLKIAFRREVQGVTFMAVLAGKISDYLFWATSRGDGHLRRWWASGNRTSLWCHHFPKFPAVGTIFPMNVPAIIRRVVCINAIVILHGDAGIGHEMSYQRAAPVALNANSLSLLTQVVASVRW